MKPVFQTSYGGKDAPIDQQGNCFQACVASILEMPLEQAFDCRPYKDNEWFNEFNKWLGQYNLACIYFEHTKEKPITCSEVKGYFIMECMSINLYQGERHVVIMKDNQVIHDPDIHANGRLGDCQGFYLLIPLNMEFWKFWKCER